MSSWRDRLNRMGGKTRFVVCRIFLHLAGQDVAPLLGVLNREARQAVAAEGNLETLGEGLVEIAQSLLQFEINWQSAANEGDVVLGGLTVLAGVQAVRKRRKDETLLAADENAVRVAQRRGYTEPEAAQALLEAIESVAKLENRPMTVTDIVRSQALRAQAGLSPVDRVVRLPKAGGN